MWAQRSKIVHSVFTQRQEHNTTVTTVLQKSKWLYYPTVCTAADSRRRGEKALIYTFYKHTYEMLFFYLSFGVGVCGLQPNTINKKEKEENSISPLLYRYTREMRENIVKMVWCKRGHLMLLDFHQGLLVGYNRCGGITVCSWERSRNADDPLLKYKFNWVSEITKFKWCLTGCNTRFFA